jgi:hypothetical protein
LDAQNEPRLKGLENTGEALTADHPFFWAGYLLVDTSPRPEKPMEGLDAGGDDVQPPTPEVSSTKPDTQTTKPEATAAENQR